MLEMRIVEDKNLWEQFVRTQPYTLFVQSASYGEFYRRAGEGSWILGLFRDGQLIGGTLAVSIHAKRGNFLYVPYGPLIPYDKPQNARVFLDGLGQFARQKKFDFIRVSPFIDETPYHQALFRDAGFRNAPMHILAETTWLLNIEKTEDGLLSDMNKNHRNLIR